MIKDVEPLLKECEETLTDLLRLGKTEVACYVQGFINSINKLSEVEQPHSEWTEESAIDFLHDTGWMQRHDEEMTRPHRECRTCKHFVKGGLDGKTYVCEHPNIEQDDYFNYAFLMVEENDFCSRYEEKEGE